jgi:hypothetical protein
MPELCRDQAPGYASVQCNYKHSASCVNFLVFLFGLQAQAADAKSCLFQRTLSFLVLPDVPRKLQLRSIRIPVLTKSFSTFRSDDARVHGGHKIGRLTAD